MTPHLTETDRRRLVAVQDATVERGRVLPTPADVRARFELTPRETEVALLLAEGLDNRRIAERLSISPHTARRHTEAVMKRLGIGSRAAVAVTLLRHA